PSVQLRETSDNRGIVAIIPGAVQFVERIQGGDVLRGGGALRMPRHADALPRCERAEDLGLDLGVLGLERGDLAGEIDVLRATEGVELRDEAFELDQALLALDDRIHRALPFKESPALRPPTP